MSGVTPRWGCDDASLRRTTALRSPRRSPSVPGLPSQLPLLLSQISSIMQEKVHSDEASIAKDVASWAGSTPDGGASFAC